MAAPVLQVCLVVLCLAPCVTSSLFTTAYALDDYCGKTIKMSYLASSMKLVLTDRTYYSRNMDCSVQIEYDSWLYSERLLVQFLYIDIDCSDHVHLSSSKSGPTRLYCGESKPLPYTTSGTNLYVKFVSDGYYQDNGFTLLISTFKTGVCRSTDFKCDNGRCVDYELKRDGYDNCGDNSDERTTYFYPNNNWWIWLIIGIAVFLVICVVITVICCCVCKRKTPGHVVKFGTQPVVYQSGAQAVQVNPWYGAPTQPTQLQPTGVQGMYPAGPPPYQAGVMSPPPAYTNASGSAVYPAPQSAAPDMQANATSPPPNSEKMEH